MTEQGWLVTVLKCNHSKVREILVDLYDFAKDLQEVKDLHFIIRDRVQDEVVFSFRFKTEETERKVLSSKISFKLKNLIPEESYAIDPTADNPLYKYKAWPWKETLKKRGQDKFNAFCHFLNRLSEVAVEMAKQDYFSSTERAEMAHAMLWVLGCREITVLMSQKKVNTVLTGLHDRIDEKLYIYYKQNYPKMDSK